jgi:hypothetical protein
VVSLSCVAVVVREGPEDYEEPYSDVAVGKREGVMDYEEPYSDD